MIWPSPSAEADTPRENHNVKTLVASLVGLDMAINVESYNK